MAYLKIVYVYRNQFLAFVTSWIIFFLFSSSLGLIAKADETNLSEVKKYLSEFLFNKYKNDDYSEINLIDITQIDCYSKSNLKKSQDSCEYNHTSDAPTYQLKLSTKSQLCKDNIYQQNQSCNTDIFTQLLLKASSLLRLNINNIEIEIHNSVATQIFYTHDGVIKKSPVNLDQGNEAQKALIKINTSTIRSRYKEFIPHKFRNDVNNMIKKWVEEYYTKGVKEGMLVPYIENIESNNVIQLTVEGVRNKVLSGFWERLELCIVIIKEGEGFEMVLFIDGKYTSGAFAPKNRKAYEYDMEPKYTAELQEHLTRFKNELKEYLNKELSK